MSHEIPIEEALGASFNAPTDLKRRKFLVAATTAIGGAGVAVAAVPFIMNMLPSAKALGAGAPVEVDISKLEPGMLVTSEWRGQPVWVVNRTPTMLAMLQKNDSMLTDPNSEQNQQPEYCKNATRSIKPEYMVLIGICTHLGCSPTYRPNPVAPDIGSYWTGGWLCACHGSRYDLAARVYQGSPAPLNMVVPPHFYLTDTRIKVGVDPKKGA